MAIKKRDKHPEKNKKLISEEKIYFFENKINLEKVKQNEKKIKRK